MEPLENLATSIPTWHVLLDDLNGKIARRQRELAEAEGYKPSAPSLKNKGSTESLRPKNDDEASPDVDTTMSSPDALQTDTPPITINPSNPPPPPVQRLGPHQSKAIPSKALPALLPPRKRKPASLASADSGKPKHRTRSMIIVYYDSAVQIALEALVKHISAARNAMRKGKMAARMAAMRAMADLDAQDDSASDDGGFDDPALLPGANPNALLSARAYGADVLVVAADPGDRDDDGAPLPKLQFVSTRRMGPPRDLSSSKPSSKPAGMSSFALPPAPPPSANIFDELDAGLEWCQSMCEHAAHQFLRDGRCDAEVTGVKARLGEVRERVMVELGPREAAAAAAAGEGGKGEGKDREREREMSGRAVDAAGATLPRTLRPIQIRRAGDREKPVPLPLPQTLEAEPTPSPAAPTTPRLFEKPVLRRVEPVAGGGAGGGGGIVVMTADAIEADDEEGEGVMGEDDLRNEFAALIARNSKYRRGG